MKRVRLIGLGLRLAVAGGRPAWVRLTLMGFGFAVGCALLLGAMSIVPASQTRDARQFVRYPDQRLTRRQVEEEGALLTWVKTQRFDDLTIAAWAVEAHGQAPVPPGIDRIPDPGEIYASPKLAEVLDGPNGSALATQLHGRLVGSIGPEGLLYPDELLAYVGRPPGIEFSWGDANRFSSFEPVADVREQLDLEALLVIVIIAAALLLPIWFFVATSTRLSAATREARLASVRLAGGTQNQVRVLAGLEAGIAAAIGTTIGIPLFLALRHLMASGLIMGVEFFPQDFAPPVVGAVVVVLGLPLLAVVITLVTMRRLVVSPLGIARHARRSHARSMWPVVLAVGIAVLAWAASRHRSLTDGGEVRAGIILGTGLTLTILGLAGTAVWSSFVLARTFAGRVPSVAGLLGMRRLEADPSSVGRVVGGVAILIALLGIGQAGYLGADLEASGGSSPPAWVRELDPSTVLVALDQPRHRTLLPGLAELPGVASVELVKRLPTGGYRTMPSTAVIETDGRPETIQALRDEIGWYGSVGTVAETFDGSGEISEIDEIRRVMFLLSVFLLMVMGVTMLVATVDWVMERRRALAVLAAVGVQAGVIRRSILVQVAVPLATSVILGVAGALVVIVLLYTAVETRIEIPASQLALAAVAVAVMVLVVTILATPWIRIARRPDLLRTE